MTQYGAIRDAEGEITLRAFELRAELVNWVNAHAGLAYIVALDDPILSKVNELLKPVKAEPAPEAPEPEAPEEEPVIAEPEPEPIPETVEPSAPETPEEVIMPQVESALRVAPDIPKDSAQPKQKRRRGRPRKNR